MVWIGFLWCFDRVLGWFRTSTDLHGCAWMMRIWFWRSGWNCLFVMGAGLYGKVFSFLDVVFVMSLIEEVKKKREFAGLPDSIVLLALEKNKEDVVETRKFLRKYFGVFLTNRVLRGKGNILESHISSRKRDYEEFYDKIFSSAGLSSGLFDISGKRRVKVLDLGCGVNGFSYACLEGVLGRIDYVGVEAALQLVDQMNVFFDEKGYRGLAVCGDLMDRNFVRDVLDMKRFDVCFLFQVVDALENMKRDYSKVLIEMIMEDVGLVVISLPVVSLGGRNRISSERRSWLVDWLKESFDLLDDFELYGERVLVCRDI